MSSLFALAGVLLGAGTTAWADRRRWHRDSVTRLLEIRTAVYAEYLAAMEDTGRALLRVLAATTGDERRREAEAAITAFKLGGVRQRIHVLAPADVIQVADEVMRTMRRARDYVATADQQDIQGLRAMKDTVGTARNRFQEAARRDVRDLLAGTASWET
ncbi:hypothetical protein [Streptomyces acidiscabies]|uniref:Uncharacterized protein n=1 Tax=Streptomyces acidiscabies TaxID=42234 RepID=A0AAP6EIN5_9ACTN|nr:hypothetical protein [Streptomyces acidiscabies]MBP5935386.1 hypothetical protein [Streptomyces sp. LBUM 1476]MBZ3916767.1 hypothetical protein [Streptomyces acidiscabies]MDX2964367.1 hypothetical protein [Streptomyces acidiscabies]MDX3024902.1 hypothetical protein [Streptomyces acidiscabies]MDX3794190.1 hypothetical protein [Streptomyces acidiscabies]